ncbi:MAG: hypothetical protein CXZ00_03530 [Acidobacteria bacterium]|nr:MAG: hypothetical protein CXZ00_03530 [Acidobacteriota bacterium]
MKLCACKIKNSQRGSALIEMALSILVTMFLMFWVFEMVMLVYTYSVLADAAKEGVRYAIVHGSNNSIPSGPGDTSAIEDVVNSYAKLSLHDISGMAVTPTYFDSDNQSPHRVQVTVTYSYIPYIPLPFTLPTIKATAQGRIVN